jgi:hypothetical protein
MFTVIPPNANEAACQNSLLVMQSVVALPSPVNPMLPFVAQFFSSPVDWWVEVGVVFPRFFRVLLTNGIPFFIRETVIFSDSQKKGGLLA